MLNALLDAPLLLFGLATMFMTSKVILAVVFGPAPHPAYGTMRRSGQRTAALLRDAAAIADITIKVLAVALAAGIIASAMLLARSDSAASAVTFATACCWWLVVLTFLGRREARKIAGQLEELSRRADGGGVALLALVEHGGVDAQLAVTRRVLVDWAASTNLGGVRAESALRGAESIDGALARPAHALEPELVEQLRAGRPAGTAP